MKGSRDCQQKLSVNYISLKKGKEVANDNWNGTVWLERQLST